MKKLFLLAVVMLSSVGAFAQNEVGAITIQPKVGLNIANLTKIANNDPRVGLAAGVEAEYQITDLLSVAAGALYSVQGVKAEGDLPIFGHVKEIDKLDYINVPIVANVYVTKGLAIKVGAQFGFCVNKKAEIDDVEADLVGVKTFDFSIPVGASYEYKNVVLDARYNWGLTKVFDNGDSKNSVFQITLGYKFGL